MSLPIAAELGALFACLAGTSWVLVAGTRTVLVRWNVLDRPVERSSHFQPMPVGGGVVIVGLCVGLSAVGEILSPAATVRHGMILVLGALLVAGISLLDDMRSVPIPWRLGVHSAAALFVVLGYGYWKIVTLPVVGTWSLGVLGAAVTFFWIVGLVNAYNFMDGIDGMAAGQAVSGGVGWLALGLLDQRLLLVVIGGTIAASSLGFLLHNWQPASIFMGDVGATFLGYAFAVVPLIAGLRDPRLILVGVLLVWPALFDSGFTLIDRLRRRQNIMAGHREFLFHRLVAAGWSHRQAAGLYLTLPLLGALLAATWDKGTPPLHLAVLLLTLIACVGLWLLVRRQESQLRAAAVEAGSWHGVERRSGPDRRARADRREGDYRGPDRRRSGGRRRSDPHPRYGASARDVPALA